MRASLVCGLPPTLAVACLVGLHHACLDMQSGRQLKSHSHALFEGRLCTVRDPSAYPAQRTTEPPAVRFLPTVILAADTVNNCSAHAALLPLFVLFNTHTRVANVKISSTNEIMPLSRSSCVHCRTTRPSRHCDLLPPTAWPRRSSSSPTTSALRRSTSQGSSFRRCRRW